MIRAAALAVALSLAGCASGPPDVGPDEDAPVDRRVTADGAGTTGPLDGRSSGSTLSDPATDASTPPGEPVDLSVELAGPALDDLVDAYAQLRDPISTTVQIAGDASALTRGVASRLADRGFGVQRVSGDVGARFVDVTALEGEAGLRVVLEIGEIELARRYRAERGDLVPADALQVAGSRRPIVLDDSEFEGSIADPATVSTVRYTRRSSQPERQPVISLITPELVRDVAGDVARPRAPESATRGLNNDRVEVANRFHGNSAFGSIAANHERIDREVVVFGDDSMRLGDPGKAQIREFVTAFDERTDLISLVGCSNGPTALEIGNEGLALGRSGRVGEELRALGVPPDRILDEGCWAPVSAGDRFPSRGVVMELLREVDA